jgi:uncharacterized membrane protein YcaP (DUF421 family)
MSHAFTQVLQAPVVYADAFMLPMSVWEKVLRTLVVYAAIAVLVRLAGKRGLAQLNTFDLVVVLLLSNVVQNAIIGDDNSLTGGLIGAVVLVAVNALMVRLAARSDRLTALFEGTPTTLVERGRYIPRALQREGLRAGEVTTALRTQNADDVQDVESAVLEPGGALVVTLLPERQNADRGDVDELHRRLDEFERRVLGALEHRA